MVKHHSYVSWFLRQYNYENLKSSPQNNSEPIKNEQDKEIPKKKIFPEKKTENYW